MFKKERRQHNCGAEGNDLHLDLIFLDQLVRLNTCVPLRQRSFLLVKVFQNSQSETGHFSLLHNFGRVVAVSEVRCEMGFELTRMFELCKLCLKLFSNFNMHPQASFQMMGDPLVASAISVADTDKHLGTVQYFVCKYRINLFFL